MKKTKFLLLCIPVVLLASSCLFTPKVESCFTFATNGNTVTFSSGCSENGESYSWDFGDGETSLQPNPTHTYAAAGNYNVILNVTGKKGKVESTTSIVSVVGCTPQCVNGTCVNGSCDCDAGYEGAACDIAFNAKFSGTYTFNENCSVSGPYSNSATWVPNSADVTKVNISGIYGFPEVIFANIGSDGLSFTIPVQTVNTTFTLESIAPHGLANATGTSITLSYRFTNTTTGDTDDCNAVFSR